MTVKTLVPVTKKTSKSLNSLFICIYYSYQSVTPLVLPNITFWHLLHATLFSPRSLLPLLLSPARLCCSLPWFPLTSSEHLPPVLIYVSSYGDHIWYHSSLINPSIDLCSFLFIPQSLLFKEKNQLMPLSVTHLAKKQRPVDTVFLLLLDWLLLMMMMIN